MEKIYDEFIAKLMKEVEKVRVGDPNDPTTNLGPIARFDLFLNLKRQILNSVENGAKLLNSSVEEIDCEYDISQGNYFKPLFLTNINENCAAYK